MRPDALIDLAVGLHKLASDDATLSALPELPTEQQLGLPHVAAATEGLLNRATTAAKRMRDDESALSDSLGAAATAYSEIEHQNVQRFNEPAPRPPWELYRPPAPTTAPSPTPTPQPPAGQPGNGHTPQPQPGPQPTPTPAPQPPTPPPPAAPPPPAHAAPPPTGHDLPPPSAPTGGPVPPTPPGPDVLRRPTLPDIVIPPGPPPGDHPNGLGGGR